VSVDPNPSTRDGFCRSFSDEFDAVRNVAGPGAAFDLDGHGTHVAATTAQCTGNGRRTAGMAPDATVMPVAVLEPEGTDSSTAVLASGIHWARTHGARVINMSLGCACISSVVSDAIDLAASADIVMVAAAGNEGGPVMFPANDPRVIAVGATTSNNNIANYSSFGAAIDLPREDREPTLCGRKPSIHPPESGASMAAKALPWPRRTWPGPPPCCGRGYRD
jgi:subtilisin family serine protease